MKIEWEAVEMNYWFLRLSSNKKARRGVSQPKQSFIRPVFMNRSQMWDRSWYAVFIHKLYIYELKGHLKIDLRLIY